MKITISATLVTALSATAANLALHIQGLRDSHPYLKTETEKTTKNYMERHKVSLEEAEKRTTFRFPSESLFSAIKAKTIKLGSIVKTDDGLEIEIKDDFIIEYTNLGNNLFIKMLKPVADLMGIVDDYQIHVDQFNQRWDEDKVEITSKVIDASQVPKSIHDSVVAASEWTVKESGPIKSPYFLDEENEKFIDIYYATWTNGIGQELKVSTVLTCHILNSKESLLDTARKVELPMSLVNSIRTHYNFSLLTNTSSSQAEVQEVTVKTDVEQANQVAAE